MIQPKLKTTVRHHNFHPLHQDIDKEGIKDFYWPYTRLEILEFDRSLCRQYCEIIADAPRDTLEGIALRVLMKYFANESIGLFQAQLLKQRSASDGVKFDLEYINPEHWRIWSAFLTDQQPGPLPDYSGMKRGPQKTSKAKKFLDPKFIKKAFSLLRFSKGGAQINGMKIAPLNDEVCRKHIVATQRTAEIVHHAKEAEGAVYFSRSEDFFKGIEDEELNAFLEGKTFPLIDRLLEMVFETSAAREAVFEDFSAAYFKDFAYEIYAMIIIHLQRLEETEKALPQHLWIGTAGYIWDCLLACTVHLRGGRVCGHDHGSGHAHIEKAFYGFVDLWICDEYRTFAPGQAKGLSETIPVWAYMGFPPPLMGSKTPQGEGFEVKNVVTIKKAKPKIFLFSTVYDRDYGRMTPLMADMPQIDWQARLAGKLIDWGYEVVIKAHPESVYLPPPALEDLGVKITSQVFEEIVDEADIFLFDFIFTSVFSISLETSKPIVLVDFEKLAWTKTAKEKIGKRCELVDGFFDEDNRPQVDWEGLKSSLEAAAEKRNNHEFLSHFYKGKVK